MIKTIIILSIIIILLILIIRTLLKKLDDAKFSHRSLSTKYGKMTEQFMPFLENYPYLAENFRFLGTPIDGVQFEEDKIVFIEFKSGNSQLSPRQQNVRRLISERQIEFEEIRIR